MADATQQLKDAVASFKKYIFDDKVWNVIKAALKLLKTIPAVANADIVGELIKVLDEVKTLVGKVKELEPEDVKKAMEFAKNSKNLLDAIAQIDKDSKALASAQGVVDKVAGLDQLVGGAVDEVVKDIDLIIGRLKEANE